jgi:hypothetical protein
MGPRVLVRLEAREARLADVRPEDVHLEEHEPGVRLLEDDVVEPRAVLERELPGVVVLVEAQAVPSCGGAEGVEVLRRLLVARDRLAVARARAARRPDVRQPDLLGVLEDLLELGHERVVGGVGRVVVDVAANAAQPIPAQQPAELLIAPAPALGGVARELDLAVADLAQPPEDLLEAEGGDLVANGE